MGQGTIRLTNRLLEEKLGIKEGISITGTEFDPFRGIVRLLLTGDDLPEKPEGWEPLEVESDTVLKNQAETKKRKSKVGMRFRLSGEESGNLEGKQWPNVPEGFEISQETDLEKGFIPGGYHINISGRFDREEIVSKTAEMNTWCHKIMEMAKGK